MRCYRIALLVLTTALLVACGGGGGGAPLGAVSTLPVPAPFEAPAGNHPSAMSLAQQCTVPRPGTQDQQGSIETEKAWVRSFMDETYLWYKEVPVVNPANYTLAANNNSVLQTLDAYFRALKTKSTTPSGKLLDQFSFTLPTAELQNQQSGIASGYGFRRSTINNSLPRVVRILYVEQGSPAQLAGISRGDTITSIDGVDISDTTSAGIATLNAGLTPTTASKTTRFGLVAPNTTTPRFVSVTSSQTIKVTPVPVATVIAEGSNSVGYLILNSFGVVSAEKQLIDAMVQFKNARIGELVLDLRYNGGGYLDIANELAWMIGDASLSGKTFEKLTCNDKNALPFCNSVSSFHQTSQGFSVSPGQLLPQLGLKRVFILTSGSTCSASESAVNGLSPFMQVIRIGSTSCGKPYGFSYANNCGTSYAAMQFKGVNALGFGDYADGFVPQCVVADDLSRQLGDPSEAMLSGALSYMRTGACPAAPSGSEKNLAQELLRKGSYTMERSPSETVRVLRGTHHAP